MSGLAEVSASGKALPSQVLTVSSPELTRHLEEKGANCLLSDRDCRQYQTRHRCGSSTLPTMPSGLCRVCRCQITAGIPCLAKS